MRLARTLDLLLAATLGAVLLSQPASAQFVCSDGTSGQGRDGDGEPFEHGVRTGCGC